MHEYVKAEPLYLDALRIRQKVLGPEFPDTANRLDRLAGLYRDMSKYAKAEPLYREALRIRQKILGPEHPDTVQSFRYKGVVLDSIVEDRLLAEASQGSEDPQLVEQLNLDKRQLGQLLLQPAQKLTAETNQRIETIEGEVEKIESRSAERHQIEVFQKPDASQRVGTGWSPNHD
jgi:tetratricopeptide (TPR) repeat protein